VKKPKRHTSPARVKPTPPRNLTPALCKQLSRDLLAACRKAAESHGLAVEGGELSDIDLRHGFDIRFRVGIPMPDGSLFSEPSLIGVVGVKLLRFFLARSARLAPAGHSLLFAVDAGSPHDGVRRARQGRAASPFRANSCYSAGILRLRARPPCRSGSQCRRSTCGAG